MAEEDPNSITTHAIQMGSIAEWGKALDKKYGDNVKRLSEKVDRNDDSINEIKIQTSGMRTDLDWLKRSYWLIAGASVGALVTNIISLFSS